jgi:uncharacterized membrane protein
MMQNNNNQRTPAQDHHDNVMIFTVVVGLIALGIAKKEMVIKAWFYDHMMSLVFWGFMLLVALCFGIRWRIQKNNKEKIERAQSLRSIKPTTSRRNDYYQRGGHFDD